MSLSKDAVQSEVFVSLFVSELENLSFGDAWYQLFLFCMQRGWK
jgi:hypothetical protein